ncbi:MAG: TraR/DksA family transcriptional regulator [Candidatus Promineifilaceae bacterium]
MTNSNDPQQLKTALEQQHSQALHDMKLIQKRLALLDEAKQRLCNQTFGSCIHCQAAINPERLKRMPFAERCLTCQIDFEESSSQ